MEAEPKKQNANQRYSTEDLLDAGLEFLAAKSIRQLTIAALCHHLGVTKGSFYHHFRNRDDFLERMLEHWVEVWTFKPMKAADRGGSAAERFRLIVEESNNLPGGTETSIRSWALREPLPRRYLERVDTARMEYLRDIFVEICADRERAGLLSRISYSLFVGTRMVVPEITGRERTELINLVQRELYGIPDVRKE